MRATTTPRAPATSSATGPASTSTAPARRCSRSSPSPTCARAPRRWTMRRRCTRSSSGSASATATCRKAASAATPTCRCASRARRFGTRREIKNLNSFHFMQQAIDYEVQLADRPARRRRPGPAGDRAVRPRHGETRAMRTKEDAARLPLLPRPRPAAAGDRPRPGSPRSRRRCRSCRGRWRRASSATTGSPSTTPGSSTQSKAFAAYFESAARASGQPKLVANWMMGEISRRMNAAALTIDAACRRRSWPP